jgi:hypothetical protein
LKIVFDTVKSSRKYPNLISRAPADGTVEGIENWVESRRSAVPRPTGSRPVSPPRSSNRTCRFPASGFPTDFTPGITQKAEAILL